MTKYKCRPGIVLEKICGEWLLIPTREASVECPHILRLALPSVFVWGMLQKGKDEVDMKKALSILTHKDDAEVQEMVDKMLQSFAEKGLLIPYEA